MEKEKTKRGAALSDHKENGKGTADSKPRKSRIGGERKHEGSPAMRRTDSYEPELRFVIEPYVDAIHRLYDCSCKEKVYLRLDVKERRGDDGLLAVRAALLVSRIEADAKEFRDGNVTDRKWHNIYSKERRLTDGEKLDVRDYCASFIEWCTFLFTDRKALVRELNVGKRRKFLWFWLP